MKSPVATVIAFLVCLAAGHLLGSRLASGLQDRNSRAIAAQSMPAPVAPPRLSIDSTPAASAATPPAGPRVSAMLVWDREIAALPLAEFPSAAEKEIQTATSTERIIRLLTVWTERDLQGAMTWAKKQRWLIALPESGQKFAGCFAVLRAASRIDLDQAWQAAGELPATMSLLPKREMLGWLLRQNPVAAVAFVRRHAGESFMLQDAQFVFQGADPEKATPVVMALPAGPTRLRVVLSLANYYSERDDESDAARRWFQTLPPAEQQAVAESAKGPLFSNTTSDAEPDETQENEGAPPPDGAPQPATSGR